MEYLNLSLACLAFVASHFLLSHPWRHGLVMKLGDNGFRAVYSLVALGTFGWMVLAFRSAPPGAMLWHGAGDGPWIAASLLTLLAALLLLGSFSDNPALPGPQNAARLMTVRDPKGALAVTRHPMMWGFALWACAHMLVAPRPPVLILAGSIGFLALAGSRAQDVKKRQIMGADWKLWEGKTSFWPQLSALFAMHWSIWLIGVAVWLAAGWAHLPLGGFAAGVWRWL